MDIEPSQDMLAKVEAAVQIYRPKVALFEPEVQEAMRNISQEQKDAQNVRFNQHAGETGIMNKDEFYAW